MSILRVRDDQGNYVEIPAIKGEPGASGVIDATTESALTGLLKGAGGHIAPAVAGTDYVAPADMAAKQNKITASGLLKGDGVGGITAAAAGADYATPASVAAKQDKITASGLIKGDGEGVISAAVAGTDYATPASVAEKQNKIVASGLLKGNGAGGVTAAVSGTDYAPTIDYIVEQGTDGIWTYRMWKSGVAECWSKQTVNATFSAWGSGYSCDIDGVAFPSNLFTSITYESAQAKAAGNNCVSSINAITGNTTTSSGITCLRMSASSAGEVAFTVYRHAIGTWK